MVISEIIVDQVEGNVDEALSPSHSVCIVDINGNKIYLHFSMGTLKAFANELNRILEI